MSNQIEYAGSLFSTMRDAADRWAVDALPDTSVIERSEAVEDAVKGLEAYWWNELERVGGGAPEGVDVVTWREACRAALVRRIECSREAA